MFNQLIVTGLEIFMLSILFTSFTSTFLPNRDQSTDVVEYGRGVLERMGSLFPTLHEACNS